MSWATCWAARSTAPSCDKALAIVRSGGAVDGALAVGAHYVDEAEAACAVLPAGPATDALRSAPSALLAVASG